MKKITGYFIAFSLVLALPLAKVWAQTKPFEGTITWTMTMPIMGDEDPHPMIINIKGKKSETEIDMGAMGAMKTYSDGDAKKIYMVMGASKTGYVADMADSNLKKTAQKELDSIDLKPTGKKETIAGHPAEEYLLTGIKMRGMNFDLSIWGAADFPKNIRESLYHSMKNNPGQDPKQTKAMKVFADKGLVPVRMVMKNGGEVAVTTEFVKYEQKSLDDALFVPPADVKFGPAPQMGGGGTN